MLISAERKGVSRRDAMVFRFLKHRELDSIAQGKEVVAFEAFLGMEVSRRYVAHLVERDQGNDASPGN